MIYKKEEGEEEETNLPTPFPLEALVSPPPLALPSPFSSADSQLLSFSSPNQLPQEFDWISSFDFYSGYQGDEMGNENNFALNFDLDDPGY